MSELKNLLSLEERSLLLTIAREAICSAVHGERLPELDLSQFPPALRQNGASFVTLTKNGQLRGCIGALEATQPLALDVQEHAAAAATQDYRFPKVKPEELPAIQIEISRPTTPQPLAYRDSAELVRLLQPGLDGVVLRDGLRRATFLPQVWEKLPDAEEFLSHLCLKMGASPELWRHKPLSVYTYRVEEFEEE